LQPDAEALNLKKQDCPEQEALDAMAIHNRMYLVIRPLQGRQKNLCKLIINQTFKDIELLSRAIGWGQFVRI